MTSEDTKGEKKSFVARNKLRLFIGIGFLAVATNIVNYLTFAKVWSGTFESYGIPAIFVYIGLPIGFILFSWVAGYLYEMSGLWEKEVSHQNTTLNPEFVKICKEVSDSKEDVADIKKDVADIKSALLGDEE